MDQAALGGSYEFNTAQDSLIERLAKGMKFVGMFNVFLGGFTMLGAVLNIVMATGARPWGPAAMMWATGIFFLSLGGRSVSASNSFFKIVRSKGEDIPSLMNALDNLRRLFVILSIFVMIYLVVVAIGIGLAVAHVQIS